ncbi:MAG: hypothetical protein KTR17_04365 [Cellvibrionaceae bacterium]|nr:hypothetical protein [Cellvibrionaceae bacterium]
MRFALMALAMATLLSLPVSAQKTAEKIQQVQETASLLQQERARKNFYRVFFPNKTLARKAAISFHAQMMAAHYDAGYLVMELEPDDIEKLESFKFRISPATEFIAQRETVLAAIQKNYQVAAQSLESGNPLASDDIGISSIPGYSCYQTVEETFSTVDTLLGDYPDLTQWIDAGDSWEKEEGLGGYDISVLKLTNKTIAGDKPKLFINSAIHAREYTTAPLTLAFANWLLENYGDNADATWLLDDHEIHLMLHTNPDGRKQAEGGILWRKNANQRYCGSTSNNRGVDLNRNFSFTWNITNGSGSSGNQCSSTYRGPFAASEPETQAMEAYVRSLWPDRRGAGRNDAAPADTSGIHLDIHSYSELVLWPWGDTNNPAPNVSGLRTLGRKFAFFNGYEPSQAIGLYPTDGTTDSVSYGELGVAAYTFELGTAFFQNCNTYNNTILPDNLEALIYAAKVVRSPYLTPAGPDSINLSLSSNADSSGVVAGTVVTLSATASDTRFNNSNGSEPSQNISQAEYYINTPPWKTGAEAIAISPGDGNFNSGNEALNASIDTAGFALGDYMLYVRSRDSAGNWGAVSAIYLKVVSDPGPVDPPQPPDPVEYCSASSNNGSEEWISEVNIGEFTNGSGSATYSDFSASLAPIELGLGTSDSLRLVPAFSGTNYREYWKIWIDLNRDGDFGDAGEEVFSSGSATSSSVSGNLSVPGSAATGLTRLRVVMRYNTAPSPCGSFNYGEVEDYSVNIVD